MPRTRQKRPAPARALPAVAALLAGAAAGCDTVRYGAGPPPPRTSGRVVDVREPITVDGEVFDMEGATYRGPDRDSQDESGLPLFILKNDAVLKNGTIVQSLEGVWFRGTNSRVVDVAFPDVYEDAVSTRSRRCHAATGARRNRVLGCYFRNFADKAIQHNGGELEVNGCTFVHGTTPIRQNGRSPYPLVTHVWNNTFHNVHSMAKADGRNPKSRVTTSNNRGTHVREPAWEVAGETQLVHLDVARAGP